MIILYFLNKYKPFGIQLNTGKLFAFAEIKTGVVSFFQPVS